MSTSEVTCEALFHGAALSVPYEEKALLSDPREARHHGVVVPKGAITMQLKEVI
jgi:hypothetical protein